MVDHLEAGLLQFRQESGQRPEGACGNAILDEALMSGIVAGAGP
ncbi:hypothetical protein ACN6KF_003480 [Labrys sp. La1]